MSQSEPAFASTSHLDSGRCKPLMSRELFHDLIDKQQRIVLDLDKKKDDNRFSVSSNEDINNDITYVVVNRVDQFQCRIETDTLLPAQQKVRYLKGMENVLRFFVINVTSRKVKPLVIYNVISAYENCVEEDKNNRSILPVINKLSYTEALSVLKSDATTLEKNDGYKQSQQQLILKYCGVYPERTFQVLKDNPGLPFTDSLVRIAGHLYPRQLYDYAAAQNQLGDVIRAIQDDVLIRSVSKMAGSKSGQQYFPFLDNIVKGKMTFEEIDAAKDDSLSYYQLLVSTQMEYVRRALNKDTAFEFASLTRRLEDKARSVFVETINALHNETPEVRFNCIQAMNAQELYYLAVSSDGSIYTSSFVKGVYPLMMKKVNNRGDSLLLLLHFDKYRKFIKMAAGYNTLSQFLGSFPPKNNPEDENLRGEGDAEKLMKAFVGKLEAGEGYEDGVDVADSYASIAESIKPLAKEMLKNVQANLKRNTAAGNKRGIAIYKILTDLFLSADTANKIDLAARLGIPPVYTVPYTSLVNDSGKVVMHVFFYGDDDGKKSFKGFLNIFNNNNWKIDQDNPQWVTITAAKGKPVVIYANRPLPEETGEDERAQDALLAFMEQNKEYPSITIHRGHSYYADATIKQMFPGSRIIFMGSCGGYHLLNSILEKTPGAHIISTKQIADFPVNDPFFQLLTDKVRNGKDINWVPFWSELDKMVTAKIFEDYIPPYKNLGALFIMAYKKEMEKE
jgi:hypothetical protein